MKSPMTPKHAKSTSESTSKCSTKTPSAKEEAREEYDNSPAAVSIRRTLDRVQEFFINLSLLRFAYDAVRWMIRQLKL